MIATLAFSSTYDTRSFDLLLKFIDLEKAKDVILTLRLMFKNPKHISAIKFTLYEGEKLVAPIMVVKKNVKTSHPIRFKIKKNYSDQSCFKKRVEMTFLFEFEKSFVFVMN